MLSRQLISGCVLLAPIGLCALLYSGRPKGPLVSSGPINEIEIKVRDFALEDEEPVTVISTNKSHIAQLLELLRNSIPTTDHRCAERGWITFKATGVDKRIGFLPGHHDNFYEFRHGGAIYKAPRVEFVHALERLGLKRVPLE